MRIAIKLSSAVWGFVLGLLLSIAAVEAVRLLAGVIGGYPRRRFEPVPPGVLIGAIATAIIGWRRAPTPERVAAAFTWESPDRFGLELRVGLATAVIWSMVMVVMVYGFGLFGRYWYAEQWQQFWVALLGPPIIATVALG